MAKKYNLPDVGKAVRILIDHARENPSMQETDLQRVALRRLLSHPS